MTTLLPTQDLAAIRSIAKTAAVLFVLLRIDSLYPGRATEDWEVADILEMDKRTVTRQLRSLSTAGMALAQGKGYVLTLFGRNTLFGFLGATSLSIEESKISDDAQNVCAQKMYLLKKIEEDSLINLDSSSSDLDTQNVRAQNAPTLKIGGEISYARENGLDAVPEITGYTFEDGTPVYRMDCVDGSFLTTREILEAAQMLERFEDGVVMTGLSVDAIKPEIALAWVAQAYDQRARLNNPAGLVYSRLRDIEHPLAGLKYRRNPQRFLPNDYLAHVRLAETRQDDAVVVVVDDMTADPVEIWEERADLVPAWEAVLREMQTDMPRASFETWLHDTFPAGEDGQTLIVATQNSYCRDWLERRVGERVALLAGRPVRFVVAVETAPL